jgi:integrase
MTLAGFWPRFVDATPNLAPSTRDLYEREWRLHTRPYLGKRRLESLKRLDVEAWIAELAARGHGPSAIEHAFRTLRRILSAAVDADILARNPASGVKAPKAPQHGMRFLTDTELWAIAEAVEPRYRALILLLGLCGPRIGEAIALTVDDVNLLLRRVSITKAATELRGHIKVGGTKTGKSRSVSLPQVVIEAIEAHLTEVPPGPGGLTFTSDHGAMIRRTNFRRRVWLPAVREAGIAGPLPRVHDLRHTQPRWRSRPELIRRPSRRCLVTRRSP